MPNSRTASSHSLWLPKSYDDLEQLPPSNVLYKVPGSTVVRATPGVVFKYRYDQEILSEELHVQRFAREKAGLQVPKVLHSPSFSRSGTSGIWYICMEECRGTSLDKVIHTMTPEALDHVAEQLRAILSRMASVKPKTLGSVTGGPYRNWFFPGYVAPKHAFTSITEFNDHYRWLLMLISGEEYTESVLGRLPRHAAIRFTHSDLLPKNIMVDGSTITGIVDWEMGGFYPAYWEYCRMHDPNARTPGWEYVLKRVFPAGGDSCMTEVTMLRQLMDVVLANF